MNWSDASLTCRIDWRPSPALGMALIALGVLSAISVYLSALPGWLAFALGAFSMVYCAGQARRHWRQARCRITWPGPGVPALIEPALIESKSGILHLDAVSVHLRGPLAVLVGRDESGRKRRWVWYPDTLDAAARRALRLASAKPVNSPFTLPDPAA